MSAAAAALDPRLLDGIAEFNAGAFFEAHEVWEELWNDAEGETKRVIQALVQIAAGYHKLELGVPRGAMKLFTRALGLLDDVRPAAAPLPLDELRAVVRGHLAQLRAGPLNGDLVPPRIAVPT